MRPLACSPEARGFSVCAKLPPAALALVFIDFNLAYRPPGAGAAEAIKEGTIAEIEGVGELRHL